MDIVFMFFLKKFFEGFVVGCVIRIIISIITRSDMTFKGLALSGIVMGLIVDGLNWYWLWKI